MDNSTDSSALAKTELRRSALIFLAETDAVKKVAGVMQLAESWRVNAIVLDTEARMEPEMPVPGRPCKPELISPRSVKQRSLNTAEGRAALIHALAHIEFNAINLALDAIWRFHGMPREYYADWLKVAAEEASHYELLVGHLHSLGYAYGDFPAHDGLWEMAEKTKDEIIARIALVPRTLEARGLDVSPTIRAKLAQAGDMAAAEILDVILRDEIGHVAIGNHWFSWLCRQNGSSPVETYQKLLKCYEAPVMRGPFNIEARRMAGFDDEELRALSTDSSAH